MEKVKALFGKVKEQVKGKAGKAMLVAMPVASAASFGAFAAEGDPASAVTAATGVFSSVVSILTDNPIMLVFIGGALVPVGFKIFKAAKGAAGGGRS